MELAIDGLIIIIINFFIEGSLISAEALFFLRALVGATWIHSYTRMASLIRRRQCDFLVTRSRHFRRGNLWVQLYPRMKTFLLVPRRASIHRRTTSCSSTLVSTQQSKQLGNQGRCLFDISTNCVEKKVYQYTARLKRPCFLHFNI